MATIQKEIEIERSKDFVWDAIRDVGAIHKRLVPGQASLTAGGLTAEEQIQLLSPA